MISKKELDRIELGYKKVNKGYIKQNGYWESRKSNYDR